MARNKNTPNEQSNEAEADQAQAPETDTTVQSAPTDEAAEKAAKTAAREADAAQAEASLRSTIDTAISGADTNGKLTDEDSAALQQAYRKISAGARGRVQAEILRDQMTKEGVNMTAVASVLEVMTKAPAAKAKATRVVKPTRPAEELVAESLTILALAQREVLNSLESDELRTAARDASKAALQGEMEEGSDRDAILARVNRAVKAASPKRSGGGGSGVRTAHSDTLADVFGRGDLIAGTVLVHGSHQATVNSEGNLVMEGVEGSPFDNPSGAASAALKSEGKASQVNGWSWWNVPQGDGTVTLGTLRKG